MQGVSNKDISFYKVTYPFVANSTFSNLYIINNGNWIEICENKIAKTSLDVFPQKFYTAKLSGIHEQ